MRSLFVRSVLAALVSFALVACEGTLQPSHQNPRGYTSLDAAVEGCDLVKTKEIIASNPGLVNERGWSNTTPLYLAALNNCTEVARFLLEKGANVNAKSQDGATGLHIAAQKNNLELVKLLLANNADSNAVDSKHRTPLDRALQWHHPDMAVYLKKNGGRQGAQL
jgi:ankyrin repeat protein